MSDNTKTGIVAALAVVSSLLAWMTTTRNYSTGPTGAQTKVNQALFEKFNDPLAAASLRIVKYDTDAEKYSEFEVAKDRKSGVWTIPSNENYPADANRQMSEAANLFVGLKALNVASEKRDEQVLFGVVEPDKKKEDAGGEGVGTLVQFRDEKGDTLADLIIGKPDSQDPKKRFVRIPSEDVIYVAEINPASLSTDFKQWIESDLLKLSGADIEVIGIRNYSLVEVGQGRLSLSKIYDADVMFNVRDGKWVPREIAVYEGRDRKPRDLQPTEELNASKLNDMKSALDNLRIVNVAKKPPGVAADLKGEQLQEATLAALQRRGFFASQSSEGGPTELFAMNGDIQVTTKDGVQYLLRFGNGAGATFEPVESQEGTNEESSKEVSINRFLLVTTRVDESKFPQPDLQSLPETVEELKTLEALNQGPKPTPPEPSAAPSADEPEADPPANESGNEVSSRGTSKTRLVSLQDPPADPPPAELTDQEWKERLDAERERIKKENQRKIDQRNDRLAVAKKKSAELNARFADWYYIVSDSEFKRLKIELSDLVTAKSPGGPGNPPGLPGQVPDFNIPGLPGR
ncbi:MAG: hypothetical protein CBB60_001730 [Armatimonadetes bacterium Cent15-Ar3]|nr:MAG: hypothetical protein CBB60_001730 [Armatimonadetes bacterium Cent15-Ar3]